MKIYCNYCKTPTHADTSCPHQLKEITMTEQDNTAMELPIIAGFLYGIQSDFLPDEEVRHRVAGFRTTKGYKEAMQLIQQHTQEAEQLSRIDELGNIELAPVGETRIHVQGDGDKTGDFVTIRERIAQLKEKL